MQRRCLRGDRSIQVKQVREHGHLDHIVTKSDFDANIRAAKVFTIQADNVNEDEQSIIKKEDDSSSTNESVLPQQCLILTLDSNDIVFLYLRTDINGEQGLLFMHQTFQMPRFDRTLFQPGQHLAVDARSRAFAVAANEREIVIYAAKSTERIQHELRIGDPDWCPVSAERAIQVEGAIQKIDFLIPRSDDENHVILLVLVVHDRKTKAIIIDWQYASDIHHAQVHEALPLDQPPSAAGLLIPLRNAAFLIANGDEIKRFDNILTDPFAARVLRLSTRSRYTLATRDGIQCGRIGAGQSVEKGPWLTNCISPARTVPFFIWKIATLYSLTRAMLETWNATLGPHLHL